jgi:prepilin-type N-terminal cleavage/methylation domain-containing protein
MRDKLQDSRQGFTLLELMLALAISGVILLGFFAILTAGYREWERSTSLSLLRSQTSLWGDMLAREVRMATKIEARGDEGLKLFISNKVFPANSLPEVSTQDMNSETWVEWECQQLQLWRNQRRPHDLDTAVQCLALQAYAVRPRPGLVGAPTALRLAWRVAKDVDTLDYRIDVLPRNAQVTGEFVAEGRDGV